MHVCMNLCRYLSKNLLCIAYVFTYMQTKWFRTKTAHAAHTYRTALQVKCRSNKTV